MLEEMERRNRRNKFSALFPDAGPFRRELYPVHMQFFEAGSVHNERLLAGGNRVGKSLAGGYEVVSHLTGLYAPWWKGKKFEEPISAWTVSDTAKVARDVIQSILLGTPGDAEAQGTGILPGDCLLRTTVKHGLSDAVETVFVKHISGGVSTLQLKSRDQGRESFQGSSQHVIWLDEEPELEIYTEALLRTMTVRGIVLVTATPLQGLTPLILEFLPDWQPKAA